MQSNQIVFRAIIDGKVDGTQYYRELPALGRKHFPVKHYCSICGNEVTESCADHPSAVIDSVYTTLIAGVHYLECELLESGSFPAKPQDKRCKYWCKIVDAKSLPLPSSVGGANDIPGVFQKTGDVEIFQEQYAIEGEENSHNKSRGWKYFAYRVTYSGGKSEFVPISDDNAAVKAAIKADPTLDAVKRKALLSGSGELAAVVRACHVDARKMGWL